MAWALAKSALVLLVAASVMLPVAAHGPEAVVPKGDCYAYAVPLDNHVVFYRENGKAPGLQTGGDDADDRITPTQYATC